MTFADNLGRWRARLGDVAADRYRQARQSVLTRRSQSAIAARLNTLLPSPSRVRIEVMPEPRYGWDARLHRDGDEVVVELPTINFWMMSLKAAERAPAYIYWLLHCSPEVREMVVTLSDGDRPGDYRFAPSTNLAHVVAIPDPYFFNSHGFRRLRRHAEQHALPWSERSTELVWRGANNGHGTFDPVVALAHPQLAAPRMRLCLALRGVPGTDVAIAHVDGGELTHKVLIEHGVGRSPIAEESWAARKFAIDVDGFTNTWSNLIVRMHFGCCVLKVESHLGYRQWYYHRLVPWEHYVPVRPDLSNLLEKIDWVRGNDAEASAIASRGQALAQSMTIESVNAEAIALITAG